ncbi:hypothetical protein NO559_15250 [Dasania sp. GY-MA-18]|uniref:Uncharacterized protein n=1 Tax=Dasania phycosphaerae TaxID=2950436 RepID=A0A9J6RQZ5_9GAMM|nr:MULTISPECIES: hypothetical protein [Dasania]MCR8924140.1 hypothetical protein [Dasania sp. GY-MA-18]MCZ0866713.1 hypothetical protein [Dasania phycosphaerae]MCZ0870298.1 hypothetical protein [Dasania phycosphaerae]
MDIFLILCGSIVLALSWFSLLVSSAKEDFTWGLCSFFLPPLSYLYSLCRLDVARDAVILGLIGLVLIGLGL